MPRRLYSSCTGHFACKCLSTSYIIACDFHNGSKCYLANKWTAYQLKADAAKNDASKKVTTDVHFGGAQYIFVMIRWCTWWFCHACYQLPPRWCTMWCCQSRCLPFMAHSLGFKERFPSYKLAVKPTFWFSLKLLLVGSKGCRWAWQH